jgi:TRAP-type mannitol/chloroaromatic compound transport system permease large subunit
VLRLLGTDKLVESYLLGLSGGQMTVLIVGLGAIALSALALDAFEIIFVVVPILAPAILMRAPDAVWVGVLILLVVQTSFLLPPFGAALILARSTLATGARLADTIAALAPFLAAQIIVLALVLAMPRLTHLLDPPVAPAAVSTPMSAEDVDKTFREMMRPQGAPALPGLPALPAPPPIK